MTELIPQFPALSPEEDLLAQEALWELVRRQARLFAPESASLPAETAAALSESVRLTLGADRDPSVLLRPELEERFRQGQRRLAQKVEMSRQLWRAAWATRPEIESRSLQDTLDSLSGFARRYDLRFFAQEIPCDIDYQLSQPVPETLVGVDYVNEWLRRLCLEQDILRRFEPGLARAVIAAGCPDYRRLLVNLYEPVAVNALGLALLGEEPRWLDVPPPLRRRLEARLSPLSEEDRAAALDTGALALCQALELRAQSTQYLRRTAADLRPRLSAALGAGTLEYVFLSV